LYDYNQLTEYGAGMLALIITLYHIHYLGYVKEVEEIYECLLNLIHFYESVESQTSTVMSKFEDAYKKDMEVINCIYSLC